MRKHILLVIALYAYFSVLAQDSVKVTTYKYYTPYRWFIDFNLKGGILSQDLTNLDLSKNYLNSVDNNISKLKFSNGTSYSADVQVGYFFGYKKHFGIGLGLIYLYQFGTVGMDNFHVEYQAIDNNNNNFRQIITANQPIKENITVSNFNIPLVLKYKTQFSEKWGLTVDGGILYNLQIQNSYKTNASFDYEAAYLYKGDGFVYDAGTQNNPNDWLITKASVLGKNPYENLTNYFDSMSNIGGYKVGLNRNISHKGSAVNYTPGSIGFLLQPSLTYKLTEQWFLNAGLSYIYQTFKNPNNTTYKLTDKIGDYNSFLNGVTTSVNQVYGLNIGVRYFFGLPKDTDHDGIPDKKDRCPLDSGLLEFRGCPDKDHDGIPDVDDSCPNIWGIAKFYGCPDTDGDGIQDAQDSCPLVKGILKFHGCPDTDGDGIRDLDDSCPTKPGPKENNGCPLEPKKIIDTPKTIKDIETKDKHKRSLLSGFKNKFVHFKFGKYVIQKDSYSYLDSVAKVLVENPEIEILVEGHCDIKGSDEINDKLSNRRAEAIKNYLVKKGVNNKNITVKGFGKRDPIAPNTTEEGRAQNRRAVLDINFANDK